METSTGMEYEMKNAASCPNFTVTLLPNRTHIFITKHQIPSLDP